MRLARPLQMLAIQWALLMIASMQINPALAADGRAVDFTIQDVVVSDPARSLPDPEFDNMNFLFCWQDTDGYLWIGQVDPVTGEFNPPDGRGSVVDRNLMPTGRGGRKLSFGPEWGFSRLGAEIYYAEKTHRKFLVKAFRDGEKWVSEKIPDGNRRIAPLPSKNWQDDAPDLAYTVASVDDAKLCWQLQNDPGDEKCVEAPDKLGYRWIDGRQALLITKKYDGVAQVALLDARTAIITQLTFDAGHKGQAFMWRAPEFANNWVMFAPVDKKLINIYFFQNEHWVLISTLDPPSARPYILSAEPFLYNGRSYLSMMLSESKQSNANTPSDIWIATIDPAYPLYRQVSEDNQLRVRKDPESLQTAEGLFIYYTEYTNGVKIIHRCATGLGKPSP